MTDVNFTFRIDDDLKKAFVATSTAAGWNASLLLRTYMRHVVETGGREIPANLLGDAERARRQAAVAYGQGSVALEGFQVPQEAHDLARKFVDGQLSIDEYAAARHDGGDHDR